MIRTQHWMMVAALAGACSGSARAHDSWFEVQGLSASRGEWRLALGTGNRFPQLETAISAEFLTARGCSRPGTPSGKPVALKALRLTASALLLSAPRDAASCWVQLQPFEVTVMAEKVPVYLNEIQATPEIRAVWAEIQSRGLPWRERYTKHARIDFDGAARGPSPAAVLPVQPLGMDLQRMPGSVALAVGQTLDAVVLRDGLPLAGQALELRNESSPLGIWRRSDAQGRVSMPLPLAGRWILRGVDLRLSDTVPDQWESRFVTLAFEVSAAPAAPASKLQQLQLEHALDQPDQGDQRNKQ